MGLNGLQVLEALESCPSGESCCGNGAKSDHQPHQACPHLVLLPQKPFRVFSGSTSFSSRGSRVPEKHENRPDTGSVGCTSRSAPPQVPISGEASSRPVVAWRSLVPKYYEPGRTIGMPNYTGQYA